MKLELTIIAIGVTFSTAALAQDPVVEGPGVKVSDGAVLHPSVGLETGAVSNVFYEDQDPSPSGLLRLVADFSLATLPPERLGNETGDDGQAATKPALDFRLGANFAYQEYLSTNEDTRAQRDIGIGAHLNLDYAPSRKGEFFIEDRFTRDTRPTNFESREKLNRIVNHLKLGGKYRPGGGALTFAGRFENRVDIFEASQSQFTNRMHNTIGARVDWRWLPITLIYFDASLGFYGALGDQSAVSKESSMPLRLKLGINTAITEFTTVRAHAGFGKGFYSSGAEFTGPLVGAEIGYRYSPLGRVTAGYDYGFQDSINANFYSEHVLRLGIDQQLDRVLLKGTVAARLRSYQGIPMTVGPDPNRSDLILDARVEGRYIIRDRYAITGGYSLIIDNTDFTYTTQTSSGPIAINPSFVRHELLVGARAAF